MPTITAIIPTYNSENSIERAVRSALNQELPFTEIIVVNDGSTDSTAEIVKRINGPIYYFEQENQGQGAARNVGLKKATGDFVAFLDADDFWLPSFTKACVKFLEENTEAVAVSSGWRIKKLNRSDSFFPAKDLANTMSSPTVLKDFFEFWGKHNHIRTGTVMIRREIIETNGYQRATLRISQDLEFWCFIATCGPWGFIPEVHWIGDSEAVAVSSGWLGKYRTRRRLCPTVEEWQSRIYPLLTDMQINGFKKIRGRVAANFAHSHLLGGDVDLAWRIVRNYSDEMPSCWSVNLLKMGCNLGAFGRKLVRLVFLAREYQKDAWRFLT